MTISSSKWLAPSDKSLFAAWHAPFVPSHLYGHSELMRLTPLLRRQWSPLSFWAQHDPTIYDHYWQHAHTKGATSICSQSVSEWQKRVNENKRLPRAKHQRGKRIWSHRQLPSCSQCLNFPRLRAERKAQSVISQTTEWSSLKASCAYLQLQLQNKSIWWHLRVKKILADSNAKVYRLESRFNRFALFIKIKTVVSKLYTYTFLHTYIYFLF